MKLKVSHSCEVASPKLDNQITTTTPVAKNDDHHNNNTLSERNAVELDLGLDLDFKDFEDLDFSMLENEMDNFIVSKDKS